MEKYVKITSVITLLLISINCLGQQQTKQAELKEDNYSKISGQIMNRVKTEFPLSQEQEKALKKMNAEYFRLAAAEKADNTAEGKARVDRLRQNYDKQLQALFSKEQYEAYTKARENTMKNLGRAGMAKASLDKSNVRSLSDLETNTMKERYALTSEQQIRVSALNDTYYQEMISLAEEEKDLGKRREKRTEIQQKREKQLQGIFNGAQYAAYRKDMEAIMLRIQKRAEEQKNALELQKQRAINTKTNQ